MLSELLTSSRGPGVIGTILALIVLLGFGGLFLMVTEDSNKFGGENIQTQIKAKENLIRTNQGEVKRWQQLAVEYDERRAMRDDLHRAQMMLKLKLSRLEHGKLGVAEQKEEIVKLEHQFDDYKKQYRVAERARAVGENLSSLSTKDGEVFERVNIRKISALGMEIRHKNGFKRIPYKSLPDEIQDRFQFTEADAKALSSTENARVRASVRGEKNYRKSVKEIRLQELQRDHREKITKWQREISRAEAMIVSNEDAIKAAESRASAYRALGNRGLNYDKAKKEDRKADRLRKSSANARSKISDLQKKMNQPAPH